MATPSITTLAARATDFKALHVPGKPLLLANVYDPISARIVGTLPNVRALASASWAVAQTVGVDDGQLTLEQNLTQLAPIAAVAHELGLPLTVDIQDGYGDRLEEVIRRVITELGAVGVNLEDSDRATFKVIGEEEAVDRVRRAVKVAAEVGVPDFVVNARADSWPAHQDLEESIRRGKKYLEAGATTVFVFWGGSRETPEEDVKKLVDAFGGRVNIQARKETSVQKKALTSADIARLGAARVSVGPQLYLAALGAITQAAKAILDA
ncbi:2-methylisocitrate lyase [Dichotomopilus funicola]|uniref:2-methylisocitrate lyase n=1 Tax=Dichotomopilus funicola TaxID=1934379 RepID=A0AAN6V2C9_9PEZI|nr:2-methylisocitrate lyase [Dichotomopilus funicola]